MELEQICINGINNTCRSGKSFCNTQNGRVCDSGTKGICFKCISGVFVGLLWRKLWRTCVKHTGNMSECPLRTER